MPKICYALYLMKKTIAAICTPPGSGGIAVIRISGPEAFEVANQIFSNNVHKFASHTAHLGYILDEEGRNIDEVLLLVMHKNRSYTGDETVEIMCHGGALITQKVLQRVFSAGAVPAGPGEFTLRAYQNGQIDLAQAEAVQELIGAKSELALKAAERQLEGALSIRIKDIQKSLTDVIAILEAWVDYPEEGLEFATVSEILEMLGTINGKISYLMDTFHEGRIASEGVSLCLLGLPNVGKSSLLNTLLQNDRAIVTPIPGTTRDLLSESLTFGGLHFHLTDTAGIRETEEIVEKEGIRRSIKAAHEADVVLILLDVTRGLLPEEKTLLEQFPKAIRILNKIDLPHTSPGIEGISLSAKEGTGIEALKNAILNHVKRHAISSNSELIITKERHFLALESAFNGIEKSIQGLQTEVSPEFLVFDLRQSLKELSTIIGIDVTEEILGAIFSKFCVGK